MLNKYSTLFRLIYVPPTLSNDTPWYEQDNYKTIGNSFSQAGDKSLCVAFTSSHLRRIDGLTLTSPSVLYHYVNEYICSDPSSEMEIHEGVFD